MNTISVIIATYNRCLSLEDTLESLLAQDHDCTFDYEIIVVDNNSTDKTKAVVATYVTKFNGRLRYLFESKQGKVFALRTGMEEARGEILVFTDDDVVVDKKWLLTITEVFDRKKIDLLAGKIVPIFKEKKPEWIINEFYKGPLVYFDLGDGYFENSKQKILPVGANMSFLKEAVQKYGGFIFSESRGEDEELGERWHRLGATIGYSPDVIVYHQTVSSRMNKNYFRKWYLLSGKNTAIVSKEKFIFGKRFCGISLWVYKELIESILKWIFGIIILDKNNFLNEVRIWSKFGIILGIFGKKTKFESLR